MSLARELHMTRKQLLANIDGEELCLWLALRQLEAEQQHKRNLIARAEAARAGRTKR